MVSLARRRSARLLDEHRRHHQGHLRQRDSDGINAATNVTTTVDVAGCM